MKTWTDEQVGWVVDFVVHAAEFMELQDWRIKLQDDYSSADAAAAVSCIYGKKVAQLWLNKDFFTYPFEQASQYLVHEMVHLYVDQIDKLVDTLQGPLGLHSYEMFVGAFNMQAEVMVDTIAHCIVELLPLEDLRESYEELES